MRTFLAQLGAYKLTGLALLLAALSSQVNWAIMNDDYRDLALRLLGATGAAAVIWPLYVAGFLALLRRLGAVPSLLNRIHLPWLGIFLILFTRHDTLILTVLLGASMVILFRALPPAALTLPPPRPVSARQLGAWLLGGLVLMVLLQAAWLCDDAYITFRTIDHFWSGYGLRWNINERVQVYTHPLWMGLITIAYGLTREWFVTVLVLSIGLSAGSLYLLRRYLAVSYGSGTLVLVAALSAKAFVDYSSSGLENPLSYLLLTVFAWRFFQEKWTLGSLRTLCLLAALAVLNRMDTLLFYLPPLAYATWQVWQAERPTLWALLRAGLAGFAPLLVWELFSLFYYGFPFPNTYYAKVQTGIPAWQMWVQGLLYFWDSITRDPLTLIVAGSGLAVAWYRRDARALCLAAGTALYLLYILRVGGDFMAGRFLALPFLAGLIQWGQLNLRLRPALLLAGLALGVGLMAKVPTLNYRSWSPAHEPPVLRPSGITDERLFYMDRGSPNLLSLQNLHPGFDKFGPNKSADTVLALGMVGREVFWLGPEYDIIDVWALTDPLLARLPVPSPEKRQWRIGHFTRPVPAGYMETRRTGRNQIELGVVRALYDKLHLVTTGPLWSTARLREIWRFNTGQNDHLMKWE